MLNSRQRLSWHCWIVPRSQHTAMWRREQSGKCSQMMSSKVGIPGLELSKSSALLCFCKQKFCFWVLSGRFIKLISVPYSVKGHRKCCKAQCNAKCLPVKKVCYFWRPRDICIDEWQYDAWPKENCLGKKLKRGFHRRLDDKGKVDHMIMRRYAVKNSFLFSFILDFWFLILVSFLPCKNIEKLSLTDKTVHFREERNRKHENLNHCTAKVLN